MPCIFALIQEVVSIETLMKHTKKPETKNLIHARNRLGVQYAKDYKAALNLAQAFNYDVRTVLGALSGSVMSDKSDSIVQLALALYMVENRTRKINPEKLNMFALNMMVYREQSRALSIALDRLQAYAVLLSQLINTKFQLKQWEYRPKENRGLDTENILISKYHLSQEDKPILKTDSAWETPMLNKTKEDRIREKNRVGTHTRGGVIRKRKSYKLFSRD